MQWCWHKNTNKQQSEKKMMGEEWPRICVNWGCDEYDERLRLGAELCAFRIFLLHFLLLLMKPKTLFIRRTVFSIYLFLNFLVSLSFFLWYEKSFALFPQTTLRPDRVYFIVGDEAAISTTEKFVWIWSYFLVIWINLLLKGTNKHWLTVGKKKINSHYFHHHRRIDYILTDDGISEFVEGERESLSVIT